MSFLILCVLNQYPGLMLTGLESLLLFIVFSAGILFIVNRSSLLYEVVIACVLRLSGATCAGIAPRHCITAADTEAFPVDDPALPFRFQRPPPILLA
jgi:hypothetical protein